MSKATKSPEGTESRCLHALVRRFEDAARSAASKEYVSELTEEEACAICMFADVPYDIDFEVGRMKFNPCGLYKHRGKWTAVLPLNNPI